MASLRFLALLALLLSLSLAVYAETTNDAPHAKDEVKPSESTDAIEPQQRGRGGCRYGCCGSYAFGRCSACCSQPQVAKAKGDSQPKAAEVEAEANSQPQASEAESNDVVVEPQQRWGGGCRYGCCGGWIFGRCNYCCRSQAEAEEAVEAVEPQQRGGGGRCRYGCCGGWRYGRCNYCCGSQAEANEVVEAIEPQQRGRGGCRYGCCGSYAFGRCSACCSQPQVAKAEGDSQPKVAEVKAEANSQPQASEAESNDVVVEPQQRWGGGCRYGCCGSWRYGRCMYCCSRPQAEADVVEPQQRRGCRYGCCGSYAHGQCSACCTKKMATEEEKKKEEAKP